MARRARAARPHGGLIRQAWPAAVRRVPPPELRWTCPARPLQAAIDAEEQAGREEARALVQQVPEPRARARVLARRRLTDRPVLALEEIVGQERAIEAIRTGLETEAPGFHVFVCGVPGTGREALVRAAVARSTPPLPRPRDRVYLANFEHPDRPRLVTLPRGKGRRFRRDLDDVLAVLRRAVPAALNHELHVARCERVRRRWDMQAARLIEDLAAHLRTEGLIVGPIPEGFGTPELRIEDETGEPLTPAALERRLAQRGRRASRELRRRATAYDAARARLEEVAGQARELARKGTLAVRKLEARVARGVAQGFADDLARAYPARAVRRWLDAFLEEIGDKVDLFLEQAQRDEEVGKGGAEPERRGPEQDALAVFRANLFVDAREHPVPPIVFEPNPTYQNLFGSLDAGDQSPPDHLRLRAGSLLQANGGVLVVDAVELFQDPIAWRALKRAVKSGWIEVQRAANTGAGVAMRPEPIRTAFKLVAIGWEELHDQMAAVDPDFPEVFKVKVQVEDELVRTPEVTTSMARALLRVARRSGLRPPDASALARLLERSARLAGRNDRLAPRFSELVDVLQEADRLAARARRTVIKGEDVEAALAQRRRRVDLDERRIQEQIEDEVVLLDVTGRRVGMVNALVVYDTGDHVFGRPCRVTAAVGVGRKGLVDIEREARLSGDSHHKGVQILAGLLHERFAQDKPLCLTATVCFEQSYAEVDGDSASLAETICVLSALADLPVDQGWAITGSLNQKGEVQPIGDVNEKVEGFYEVCLARGLTGRQGVVVPEANVRDLMLREDVVDAVARGRFHVAAVRTLDEALELLTGTPAGARPGPLQPWPDGSVNARADARLAAYARAVRRYEAPE
ncbi:MAG: AAA family ATPase [Planctomycetes bacterium]|nr:AAA family ATPase [Planctomycetota bacterium]